MASAQSKTDSLSPSIIVTVLVIAAAVILSGAIYLLLRCLRNRHRRDSAVLIGVTASHRSDLRSVAPQNASLIESLPLFAFSSLTGTAADSAGDCAVCLSKFEPHDQLRLLPVCCHAFHTDCIDAWIGTNQTCPLCRSPIFVSEMEVMNKILSSTAPPNSAGRSGSESFRVEIGSVSHRRRLPSDSGSGNHRRSYSIGSFDYIVDDVLSEVTVSSTHNRSDFAVGAEEKSERYSEAEIYAAAVAGGEERGRGSWLKDYVDRIARTASFSLSSSFRSSGRFFVGSSRRTEASRATNELDLEASRLGDEIGEMFRWLSGV